MKNIKAHLFVGMAVLLAACASVPPPSQGPDLTGNWVLTTESPQGVQDSDMVVNQEGEQLSGTITNQIGSINYRGTLTGKDVAFGFSFEAQGTLMQIDYKGVVEGDTMKGTTKFGHFGDGSFTAKRKQS